MNIANIYIDKTNLLLFICFLGSALLFMGCGMYFKKAEARFYKDKKFGKAIVEGVRQTQSSSDNYHSHSLFVTLEGDEKARMQTCETGISSDRELIELGETRFRKGNIIDVYYIKTKLFGFFGPSCYDIRTTEHVRDMEYSNPRKRNLISYIMYGFAALFFVVSAVCLILGAI